LSNVHAFLPLRIMSHQILDKRCPLQADIHHSELQTSSLHSFFTLRFLPDVSFFDSMIHYWGWIVSLICGKIYKFWSFLYRITEISIFQLLTSSFCSSPVAYLNFLSPRMRFMTELRQEMRRRLCVDKTSLGGGSLSRWVKGKSEGKSHWRTKLGHRKGSWEPDLWSK
jgi:hypothetical protein